MAEDISMALRIAIVLCFVSALLATAITVTIPSTKTLTEMSGKFTTLASMNYNQLKTKTGYEMNGTRIYRYVSETYQQVATVVVRENPVTQPSNYKVIICKENHTKIPTMDGAINAFYTTHRTDDDPEGFAQLAVYFEHDYVTDDFRLTVNVLDDGGLEILCDKVDEFYE